MTLNLISNRAAAIANRKLALSTRQVTDSARKLSSGSRVDSARDDAAAMAIGSRLNSELVALRQVQLNATQAASLLQIAEGAVARVQDSLVRLKALATQAGSGNLSNVERRLLDVEYQQLLAEVNRLTADTKFNGNQLVNSNQEVNAGTLPGALTSAGIVEVAANGIPLNAAGGLSDFGAAGVTYEYRFSYNETTSAFRVTLVDTNAGAPVGAHSGNYWEGIIDTGIMDTGAVGGSTLTGGAVKLVANSGNTAPANAGEFIVTFRGPQEPTGTVSFDSTVAIAATAITIAGSNTISQGFKVGTGAVLAEDQITIALQGVNGNALGLTGSNIMTTGQADAANAAIDLALEIVIEARARIGSTQNRVEATGDNIAINIENIDAARSAYLDLNIAEEISNFTAKQVLQQAGVAIAAQANQLPSNLLQLFQ